MPTLSNKPTPVLRQTATAGEGKPSDNALLASGSGTAMASVCAVGLFQIEQLVGGLWAVGAVLLAGMLCLVLSRVFSRLMYVVPTGAGLIAYVSRALGKRHGVVAVAPYLMLMLFLVGFEALIVGELFARLFTVPSYIGALIFLIGTWAICQAGLRIGYQAQAIATAGLFFSLIGISLLALFAAGERGELQSVLLKSDPGVFEFAAAVGQALFLFMGFELLTSHVELAGKESIKKAMSGSVWILIVFYSIVAMGISCLVIDPSGSKQAFFVPQLAIAEQAGGTLTVAFIAVVCILASFSSFNGALLAMSRLTYALASQGVLPKHLAQLDPRTLTARSALNTLLILAVLLTSIIYLFAMYEAAIFAAAIAAALVYAMACFIRERQPFLEEKRSVIRRLAGITLAMGLVGLAAGVLLDAREATLETALLLIATYGFALLAAIRAGKKSSDNKMVPKTAG
ncbi:MAG: APC family permease [Gammaproteobacteria bacterium]|nr:APC family permease [Gammaproteobacteria bacterium]MDH5651179.1 APC family permease [Gammaproteobacteria bacterium]